MSVCAMEKSNKAIKKSRHFERDFYGFFTAIMQSVGHQQQLH